MIRSRDNPRARLIRRLRQPRGRKGLDLLLLEGPHLVTAGAEARLAFRELLVTPEFLAARHALVERVEQECGLRALQIEPGRLGELADADAPRGIAAIAEPPVRWRQADDGPNPAAVDPSPAQQEPPTPARDRFHLYLDGIQDPGNLGAIARSAEASGVASLILGSGTVRPGHPRALRSSAGSLLRLSLRQDARPHHLPTDACWLALSARTPRGGSPPAARLFRGDSDLRDLAAKDVLVLAVGAESRGLSWSVAARVDRYLTIPMAPPVESLNAAVAASLALFELRRLLQPTTS